MAKKRGEKREGKYGFGVLRGRGLRKATCKMHVLRSPSPCVFSVHFTALVRLCLPPELFRFTAGCLSPAKPAALSPDLGVTKQSP